MKNLLSVQEAADLLGCSVYAIFKWRRQKSIPYLKIGSRLLFDPDRLEEWARSKTVEPVRSE